MAVFKCKMCGGSLEVTAGETIIECEYCGTQQTLPKTTDENIQSLFNRANLMRQKNDFDKAEAMYEKILEADETEAEAYWGVILCKFGIEYVEDPKTYKRIPTCHRTSYDSIVADEYYKKALEYADASQRAIYESEAKKIDEIQKGILAISAQEEPYDIFICYKETDESGKRTQDSVIANDIYYQLTQEGFKVFYAAITLEDKLGSAYEPIIFAALNSSKVMLSIGTKPEYFNAVWVKNEWSRFLKMMKNDRSKMLIPCYKGMDAYELPEEFAHLQAQDMAKIGFINDIVRGIKKVIAKDESNAPAIKETVVTSGSSNSDTLLERAFMFMEDEDWDSAEEYCEKALDADPRNAQAYVGKLMAAFKVKNQEQLKDQKTPFDDNNNYQKAIRFADDTLKSTLIGYIEYINTRNENERLQKIYERAVSWLEENRSSSGYLKGAELFEQIIGYKDSDALAQKCREMAEVARKDETLSSAKARIEGFTTIASCEEAIQLLSTIAGWRDADEQLVACQKKLKRLKDQAEAYRIEQERQDKKREKRNKVKGVILICIACAGIVFVIVNASLTKSNKYNEILSLKESNQPVEAYILCQELLDYKDCNDISEELETIILKDAEELYFSGEAQEAADLLSRSKITDPGYDEVASGNYSAAIQKGLTDIVIPNGVTEVKSISSDEKLANKVTSITISNSVQRIKKGAFSECSSLTSIILPFVGATKDGTSDTSFGYIFGADSYSTNHQYIPASLKTVVITGGTSIASNAFFACSGLTSITIPNSVTSIASYAFSGCKSLTSITIPNSVTSIGYYAFCGCTGLTSVTIPNSVTSIAGEAFRDCTGLTSITIPNSVTSIGSSAFYGCTGLTSVTIPNSVTSIAGEAFRDCTGLTSITIPNSVTSIGSSAFYGCTGLTSVTIPNSVTSIGSSAFRDCTGLTSVIIGNGVTSIGSSAFYGCSELTNITFNGSVSQWNAISKGSYWNNSTGNYTIYCTDGTIAPDGTVTYN